MAEIKTLQFTEGASVTAPTAQPLEVADATNDNQAINQGQLKENIQCATTVVALRALTIHEDCGLATVRDTRLSYVFDSTNSDADDGADVIKPDDISGGNPGRWLRTDRETLTVTVPDFTKNSFNDYVIPADDPFDGAGNTDLTTSDTRNPNGLSFADLKFISGEEVVEFLRIQRTGRSDLDLPSPYTGSGTGKPEWVLISPELDKRFYFYGAWFVVSGSEGTYIQSDTDGDFMLATGVFDSFALRARINADGANDIDFKDNDVDTGTNLSIRGSNAYNSEFLRVGSLITHSSLTGLGLDIRTIKVTNGASDSDTKLRLYGVTLYGDSVAYGDRLAGNAWVNKGKQTYSESLNISAPTVSGIKGAMAYQYVDRTDDAIKSEVVEPEGLSTTATSISSGTNSWTVVSSTGYEQGDIALLKEDASTTHELILLDTPSTGTTLDSQTNTVNAYGASTITRFCRTGASASINHDNEKEKFQLSARDFGKGGPDGFSDLDTGVTDKAYFMEDGSTGLVGDNVSMITRNGLNGFEIDASGKARFHFSGTGLDIWVTTGATTTGDLTYIIDGVVVGTVTKVASSTYWFRICSEMPNCQHQIAFTRDAGALDMGIAIFKGYDLKTPDIFSGASQTEQSGNIFAISNIPPSLYLFNPTAGASNISYGISRLIAASREFYPVEGTGGSTDWALNISASNLSTGLQIRSNRSNAILNWAFYGTGFEFAYEAGPASLIDFTVNGLSLTSGNFGSATFHETESGAYDEVTNGRLDANVGSTPVARVAIEGLSSTPQVHIVQIDRISGASNFNFQFTEVIGAPGFSNKNISSSDESIPMAFVGGIEDVRKFQAVEELDKSQGIYEIEGKSSGPTTTATTAQILDEMTLSVKSDGEVYILKGIASIENSGAGNRTTLALRVDNETVCSASQDAAAANAHSPVIVEKEIYLTKGTHNISIFWNVSAGTATSTGIERKLTASRKSA